MKNTKTTKRTTKKQKEEEIAKILAHFFKESSKIVNTAIKESHRKYPELFKSS